MPNFSNPADAARAWAQEYEARQLAERSKALIGNRREAAALLRKYEGYHRAKGTEESDAKAEVNAAMAARFEATIAKATE